jgi:membrane protease YdiL (CAAX protease family)
MVQKFELNQWFIVFNNANSFLKLTLFLVIWAVVWLPIAIPLARLVRWHPAAPISIKQKLSLLTSLYLIAPFLVWWTSRIEGVSLVKYGLTWHVNLFQSILFGLSLGIISIILVYWLEGRFGWLQWELKNFSRLLKLGFPLLIVALFVGFIEEMIFRGVFFNFLREDFSLTIAAIISSLVFAVLHLIWERENSLPQLPGLFLMGIVLVMARLVDGDSLGLAIGLHSGWIFSLSCLDTTELYSRTEKSKKWLVGEEGKPLASVAGIIVLLFCGMILRFMVEGKSLLVF